MDYSLFETEPAVPEASSMIETFRAIGYTIEAAVADIIDNSVSAGASGVWVDFEWKGNDTWLSITDNGTGMDSDELVQAMRPGSKNPLTERGEKDLGRFGLGLKTASFSQCRKLTATSHRKNGEPAMWTWDLDFVRETGRWELLKYRPEDSGTDRLTQLESGTAILWNDIDRLVQHFRKDDQGALEKFMHIMNQVKRHLAMVFHRFMESGKLKIFFQDRLIEPWNPFLPTHKFTQAQPEEHLLNGKVFLKGYVLPHKSKLSGDEFRAAEGPRGWNEQQGFYIYRNQRLLLAGDWLGMYRKEEHYKLARIMVDIPNSLDAQWQIDIKKSVARPPLLLRDQLKAYAGQIRNIAVEVYRHRGKTISRSPGQPFVPLWAEHKRGDKWYFKINRTHPLVEKAMQEASENPSRAVDLLLRFVEETVPVKSIYIREAEQPEHQGSPFDGAAGNPVGETLELIFRNILSTGTDSDQAKKILINTEPFNHYPHLIDLLQE
ncbi:ATP-binding protein [Mucilaginibacter aquatilis]|uniref:ATP-binding protein n=1 Tax=Mucilaginibacter aquatilis TaxID=1517760 RepID=A0A6I4I940_9SPHI|nr:ATP-binding protein [Mucilaginibacter aquatilis]MVN91457.1 ATP-binding protein [Mucilaginibacter aquatilis]